MAPYIRLVTFLGAIALRVGLSTAANTTIDLFVVEGGAATPTVEASIITVIPSLSETQYLVSCPDYDEEKNSPPCNLIDGARVTMNPTGMTLNVSREATIITEGLSPDTMWETGLTLSGTATCNIHGSTSASCTGHLTSRGNITSHPAPTSGGGNLAMFGVRTFSEDIGGTDSFATIDMGWYTVPVTVTGGLEYLPAQTSTSTSDVNTLLSSGGVARATGVVGIGHGQAVVVAGAVAIAGGVAWL